MRIKKLLVTAVVAFAVASLVALALSERFRPPEPPPQPEPLPDALIVFCFHGNERPEKCKKMEAYTREVLEKSFADPLKEEKIVWRVLNYEDPENAHLKDDFRVVSSCIVLGDARSNRPGIAKNLQKKAWELVDDKEAFKEYIRTEVEKALK
jgi:hypothetical protein